MFVYSSCGKRIVNLVTFLTKLITSHLGKCETTLGDDILQRISGVG